ncbi:MAG: phosphoenolpyruvate carboxykinase (ATP) [Dehalococcoidales bacterium]|nr:phosphoenolpyruvate carboxykinase (ATP) [Dehalococcoidales bacterium]
MPEFDLTDFIRTFDRIKDKAAGDGRLSYNPSRDRMNELLEKQPGVRKTIYGNYVAESEPTSRAAMFTKNSVDSRFGEEEKKLLEQCEELLGREKLICTDRIVGDIETGAVVRLIVPERFAHVAVGGGNLFWPVDLTDREPEYRIVFYYDENYLDNAGKPLPEKDITIRLAMLPDGRFVKVIRNGNYIGEYKKGVFAAEDWAAKTKKGGIFLHAGCREDYLQSVHGDYRKASTVMIALSANGKTTTTSRILAKKGNEKSWLIQDDGGTLMPDGSFLGFEAGGIFVKTEGVNPGDQTEIFYGLMRPDTVCENVYLTEDGDFDFYNFDRTSNGRAVIMRKDFMHASPHINVPQINNFIIITRGPLIPAISKLTCQQAAAMMVLGQAMESSAGDPTKAGTIRTEFFYDPFVAGDLTEHANIFYNIVKDLPGMNFYLLNTGSVGEGEHFRDIRLEHTMGILDSLIRGGLEDWQNSPTGFLTPAAIRVVDDIYIHPERLYSKADFEQKQAELDKIRHDAVEKLGDKLHPDIRKVFSRG